MFRMPRRGRPRRGSGPKTHRPACLSCFHRAASYAAASDAALHGKGAEQSAGGGYLRLHRYFPEAGRCEEHSVAAELIAYEIKRPACRHAGLFVGFRAQLTAIAIFAERTQFV